MLCLFKKKKWFYWRGNHFLFDNDMKTSKSPCHVFQIFIRQAWDQILSDNPLVSSLLFFDQKKVIILYFLLSKLLNPPILYWQWGFDNYVNMEYSLHL